jgi:hypothetical protein
MVNEAVLILTGPAFKSLKRMKGGHEELLSCKVLLNDNEIDAKAFWWKGRPCTAHQAKQLVSLQDKISKLECSEYLMLVTTDVAEEPTSLGCYHDHPFTIKTITTFEVSDGR